MKALILPFAAALALGACGDSDTAIDTTADVDANGEPVDLGESPSVDGSTDSIGTDGTTGAPSTMGSNASGSVSDGPMPGPDSGEANEGGTNPNDTDVGLDDSVDAEESY